MPSIQNWVKGRPLTPPGKFNLASFALFTLLCVGSTVALGRWPVFAFLVVLDTLGTLASIDIIVSADRGLYFIITLFLILLKFPLNIFSLSIEVIGLVALLDFSYLLRRVDGTAVDYTVLINRVKSYAYTMLPAFLLTYLLLYLYSFNLQFSLLEAALALGLSTVGIFVSIYAVIRFFLSLDRRI